MTQVKVDHEALRAVPFFSQLPRADLVSIVQVGQLRSLKRGAVLFRQGEPARSFFVIMRGWMKASAGGLRARDNTARFLGPGEMIGGPALFADRVYPVTAEALETAVVLGWSGAAISTLVTRYPALARNIMLAMAKRIVELQNRCQELATESVERRLARALLGLAERAGTPAEDGILLDIRLSRQHLADMVGATLFTVSRTLSAWQRQGVVRTGRQKVVICSAGELRQLAAGITGPGG